MAASIENVGPGLGELLRAISHPPLGSLWFLAARGELRPDKLMSMCSSSSSPIPTWASLVSVAWPTSCPAFFGGRTVDVVSPRYLNARIRDSVLAEAKTLYAQG